MQAKISSEMRWLMDRAADRGVPVHLVLPDTVDQVAQWNASCPRWQSLDVFAMLRELEHLRWIRFSVYDAGRGEALIDQPTFNHQALIEAHRHGREQILYKLTDAGGLAWEQAAKPRWGLRYVQEVREGTSPAATAECVVTAMTEQCAREALLVAAVCQNFMVVPGSERYTSCGRWNATYWKEIDCGAQAIAAVGVDCRGTLVESLLPLDSQRQCGEIARKLGNWFDAVDEPGWQRHEYLNYGGMWG